MQNKSTKKSGSVCVVIPMYNEEKIVKRCVKEVSKERNKIKSKVGFIVVNAASKDKTEDILKKETKKKTNNLIVVNQKNNRGYGGALIEGAKKAQKLDYEYVLFMDSDLTNHPKDIKRFLELTKSNVDCVKATRYEKGGKMVGVPYWRQIISILGNSVYSKLFGLGIKDCTNGFRMIKTSLFLDLDLKETGFPIILEELYKLKKKMLP